MKTALFILLFSLSQFSLYAQELRQVTYKDGDETLNGLVTSNTGDRLPGVLILPAWKGIDQEAKTAALALQKEGYIAFIADIYGVGNIPKDNNEAAKIATKYKNDHNAYQKRIRLALEELSRSGALPEKIAVIGYCFGGAGALEAARGGLPVNGVICIHGSYAKSGDRPNSKINTKVLIEHAADDKSISSEEHDGLIHELNEGKADWQIITYANSGHTFTDPDSKDHNSTMAKRAWDHTLLFLHELLKP